MKQKLNNTQIFLEKVANGKIIASNFASEYAKIINEKEKSYYHILRKKLIPVGDNAEFRCFIQKFNPEVYENKYDFEGNIMEKGMVEELKTGIVTNGTIIELWTPKQLNPGADITLGDVETIDFIRDDNTEIVEFPEPTKTRKK